MANISLSVGAAEVTRSKTKPRQYINVSILFQHLCILYVVWILVGVLAFVTHLGEDLEDIIEKFDRNDTPNDWTSILLLPLKQLHWSLPAYGRPNSSGAVDSWTAFFVHNLPYALLFVAQHSLMRLLKKVNFDVSKTNLDAAKKACLQIVKSRVAYNLFSAITLHYFLCNYVPYKQVESHILGFIPIELVLPVSSEVHAGFAILVMAPCFVVFLTNPATKYLLYGSRDNSLPSGNMDAITQMAVSVHRKAGTLGFVLFSGISIVPRTIRIDDVIVRVVAALYLRNRSAHFRAFSSRIAGSHELAWVVRGGMLVAGLFNCPLVLSDEQSSGQLNLPSFVKESVGVAGLGLFCVLAMRTL